MNGFVLIEADVGTAEYVATMAGRLAGVESADGVTGPYDVIVRMEVDDARDLEGLVEAIQALEGVTRIVTCLGGAPVPVA